MTLLLHSNRANSLQQNKLCQPVKLAEATPLPPLFDTQLHVGVVAERLTATVVCHCISWAVACGAEHFR